MRFWPLPIMALVAFTKDTKSCSMCIWSIIDRNVLFHIYHEFFFFPETIIDYLYHFSDFVGTFLLIKFRSTPLMLAFWFLNLRIRHQRETYYSYLQRKLGITKVWYLDGQSYMKLVWNILEERILSAFWKIIQRSRTYWNVIVI